MSELYSHVVNVRTLPRKGRHEKARPTPEQMQAIADQFDLLEAPDLAFEADIAPWRGGGAIMRGTIKGAVVQPCVVTLEPVSDTLDEVFEARFVPEGSPLSKPRLTSDAEMVVDPEGDDTPETFSGDTLDLGAIWLEFLALSLDPYPRVEGASLDEPEVEARPSPFAALAALKDDTQH